MSNDCALLLRRDGGFFGFVLHRDAEMLAGFGHSLDRLLIVPDRPGVVRHGVIHFRTLIPGQIVALRACFLIG